ncbi:hypothetical protein EIP86_006152 [Pleurotus ostreatoroseus]|nr:hypothetical protein EIP86_006152 [Pleurotus ostreatoroseus]
MTRVKSTNIEDSLVLAPPKEQKLFATRDQFDAVVVCDESSKSIGESPALVALMRAIYEVEFSKILRNIPVILVGGVRAWQEELGASEMVGGGVESSLTTSSSASANAIPIPSKISPSALSPPQTNGVHSPPQTNGIHSPSIGGVLTPSPRLNGMMPPLAPLPSPSLASASIAPIAPVPIPAHVRAPAESSSASAQFGSPPLAEASIMGRSRSGTDPVPETNGYKMWRPPANAGTPDLPSYRHPAPLIPGNKPVVSPPPATDLTRRPAMTRPASHSVSAYTSAIPDNTHSHRSSPSLANGTSSIQYPSVVRTISSQMSGSSFGSPSINGLVSLPPQASINPSPLSRRRSDYIDQSQEALSNIATHPPIDYPNLSSQHILRPPPAAASSSMERQDSRPRIMTHTGPKPPMIQSDYPVTYWADIQIGTSGLKNLGNTCYMNSTIQCLSATVPFARFFTDGRWKSAVNMVNPMGSKGQLAQAFAYMLRDMWQGENQCLTPLPFRIFQRTVSTYAKQFAGSEQHDSQEFLSVLLDGLHEDLNRVLHKPSIEMTPEREAELEKLPTQLASEQQWQMYRMRDDSLVVDFFQGQYRSKLECLTCHKTSTTYNTFMYLTLPIPTHRGTSRVSLQQCLDAFVKEEVMEKSDAWNCPNCKTLRKATKLLSLARLPPVLLIHLKRFSVKGHFTEKIETCVDFPLKGLDLTNYMPAPLPPGVGGALNVSQDDPRAQIPPYRYDLYGVTNHFGTLSSGHFGSCQLIRRML